jgi:hypothetical protein
MSLGPALLNYQFHLSPVVVNWTTEFINTRFESSIVDLNVNDGSWLVPHLTSRLLRR